MDGKRLKQLAGINEEVDMKAAIDSFKKIIDLLVSLQDEIYSMDASDREECLELVNEISDALKELKGKFSRYI